MRATRRPSRWVAGDLVQGTGGSSPPCWKWVMVERPEENRVPSPAATLAGRQPRVRVLHLLLLWPLWRSHAILTNNQRLALQPSSPQRCWNPGGRILDWLEVDTDIIGHPPVLCVANCTDPTGLSRWGLQARDATVADIATQHVLPGPKPILTRHCCCLNVKRPAGLLIHERKTA